ncbi:PrsW family glutamic-type intramembrane protease [Microlunatus speluncae]|uniref:PrsW family glutamic-type intramembrane protease n=1 Tax=Microlunatus speluncae TaxID=2594267 RepID=UPI001375FBFA|nr:PrsW family glutamic-type intramembrane protease [Microlunatus speluncae]
MIIAACYGVLQLAALGSVTRSIRVTTLLLAAMAGAYGCGMLALIGEIGYTRMVAMITGDQLYDVIRTASHTVDPFIEELVKVLPLILIAWLARQLRQQWGVTDYLLVGAAIGTGFAWMEAMLRFAGDASRAISDNAGGFLLLSLSPPQFAGIGPTLLTWLPPPVRTADILGLAGASVNLHLAWTALAGLGLGLVVRMRGPWRLLGLLPLLYACIDHAVNNYAIVSVQDGFVEWLLSVAEALRNVLPFLVLVGLVLAVGIDLFLLRDVRRANLQLITTAERNSKAGALVLFRYATLAPPLSALAAIRFALARRSVRYALAARPDDPPPLQATVVEIAALIDASFSRQAWHSQQIKDLRPTIDLAKLITNWRVIVWLILGVPLFLYFVLGATPATSGVQDLLGSPVIFVALVTLTVLAIGYGGWQLGRLMISLRQRDHGGWGEDVLRTGLRISIGAAALLGGSGAVVRALTGTPGHGRAIYTFHILEALGEALLVVAILMALAGLFIMFPPGGAVLAVAGGGTVASGAAVAGILKIAAILGLSGIALMAASQRGGHSSGGGRKGEPPRNNQAQNKQADSAIKSAERELGRRLDKDEKQRVHRMISKQGYTRDEIIDLILSEFG